MEQTARKPVAEPEPKPATEPEPEGEALKPGHKWVHIAAPGEPLQVMITEPEKGKPRKIAQEVYKGVVLTGNTKLPWKKLGRQVTEHAYHDKALNITMVKMGVYSDNLGRQRHVARRHPSDPAWDENDVIINATERAQIPLERLPFMKMPVEKGWLVIEDEPLDMSNVPGIMTPEAMVKKETARPVKGDATFKKVTDR